MPVSAAEKKGLMEWVNSFGVGNVGSFKELSDGQIIMKIVAKIAGHPIQGLADMKKSLYNVIEHKKDIVNELIIEDITKKEETLHHLLEIVVLAIIDSPEKNEYIADIMKLSPDTQQIMMMIMKRAMGMTAEKPVAAAVKSNVNLDDVDEMERQLLKYKAMYEEGEEQIAMLKGKVKELQDKLRMEVHNQEEMMANTNQAHDTEMQTIKKRLTTAEETHKRTVLKLQDEMDILKQQNAGLPELQQQLDKLKKRAAEATSYKQKYEDLLASRPSSSGQEPSADVSGEVALQKLKDENNRLLDRIKKMDADVIIEKEKMTELSDEINAKNEQITKLNIEKSSLTEQVKNAQGPGAATDQIDESMFEEITEVNAKSLAEKYMKKVDTSRMMEEIKSNGKDVDVSSMKTVTDLQKKLMDEYQNTLSEREAANSCKTEVADLQTKINESERKITENDLKWKKEKTEIQNEKHELEVKVADATKKQGEAEAKVAELEGALKAAKETVGTGAAVGGGGGEGDPEALKILRTRMTNQYNNFKGEQQLIASVLHEIGLRYHQLLDEYRSVIKETGREDRLFFRAAK